MRIQSDYRLSKLSKGCAYGCAYGVAAIITIVIITPGLIILQVCFPRFWWVWMTIGIHMFLLIFTSIYVPAIKRAKSELSELNWEELEYLKQQYPVVWRQVVKEHFQRGLLETIKRSLRGEEKSLYEEFLERVRQLRQDEGLRND